MVIMQLLKKFKIVFIDCNKMLTASGMYYSDNGIVIQNTCCAKI